MDGLREPFFCADSKEVGGNTFWLYFSFIESCILWIGIKEEKVILVWQTSNMYSVAVGKY